MPVTTTSLQPPCSHVHRRRMEERFCRHHLGLERAHLFKSAAVQSIAARAVALIGSEGFHPSRLLNVGGANRNGDITVRCFCVGAERLLHTEDTVNERGARSE